MFALLNARIHAVLFILFVQADVPAGEGAQFHQLHAAAVGQSAEVFPGFRTTHVTTGRPVDDVTCLIGFPVGGGVEHQVLRELHPAVAHVHAGEEGAVASLWVVHVQPVHARAEQVVVLRRITHTGIAFDAPVRGDIPGIFGEHGVAPFIAMLPGKQVGIEAVEMGFHEGGHRSGSNHAQVAVIGGFHGTAAGDGVDDQILFALAVGHAEADGKHELICVQRNLNGPQVLIACLRCCFQVYLHHKEFHAAVDIRLQHFVGRLGNLVTVFDEPGFQSIAFFRRKNKDVVLTNGIARFDVHTIVYLRQLLAYIIRGFIGAAHHPFGNHRHFPVAARCGIKVFHEARSGVSIEAIEQAAVDHADVLFFQHMGHGNHHGKVGGSAFEVVAHGDDRALSVADHDYFALFVVQRGAGLRHIEATKGTCFACAKTGYQGRQEDFFQDVHIVWYWFVLRGSH